MNLFSSASEQMLAKNPRRLSVGMKAKAVQPIVERIWLPMETDFYVLVEALECLSFPKQTNLVN